MGYRFATLLLSVVAATVGACSSSNEPAPGGAAVDDWIAYQTTSNGTETVRLIHPDGSDDHEIATDLPDEHLFPDWSPDGQRLLITTHGAVPEMLAEVDIDTGSTRYPIACSGTCLGDDEAVYSPDGNSVAFIRAVGPLVDDVPTDCGMWIGDLAAGTSRQVTSNTACDREYQPHWSPDGEWIVYSTRPLQAFQRDGVSNLYRMNPDGTSQEQLTTFTTSDERATQPRYTPDGTSIVFTMVTPSSRTIATMPAGGGDISDVTTTGLFTHPAWQPSV